MIDSGYQLIWIYYVSIMYSQVKFNEQVVLNNKLMEEMSKLKHETLPMKEIPKRLCESVASCRDIYKDVIVTMKVNSFFFSCVF